MTRPHARLLILLILLLAFGLRLHNTTTLAAQADEGVHITTAEQVASGKLLYRDLFENRTPAVTWLLAALFRLAGSSLLLGRLLGVGMALLTIAALGKTAVLVAQRLGLRQGEAYLTAVLATLFFTLAPLSIFWARFTMLEHFTTALTTLSLLFAIRARPQNNPRHWFYSGLFVALAILAKQTQLILLPLFALFFLWQWRRPKAITAWLLGVALPLGLATTYLLLTGSLTPFLQLLSGADRLAPLANWPLKLAAWGAWLPTQPTLLLALLALWLAWQRRQPEIILLLLWGAAEGAALLLPPPFTFSWGGFSHYVISFVAALCLLASLGLVGTWHFAGRWRPLLLLFLLLLAVFTGNGWRRNVAYAVVQQDYPGGSHHTDAQIGQALAMTTAVSDPVHIFANAIFYHLSHRPIANRFFHYPDYLSQADQSAEITASLKEMIAEPQTAVILAANLHLQERLPDDLTATLWQRWQPAARFVYPYQDDLFLFLPRHTPDLSATQTAVFATTSDQPPINLNQVYRHSADAHNLLIALIWTTAATPSENDTSFIHALNQDGQLIGQHDGVPVVGFRPTTSWQANEIIVDWHWVTVPDPYTTADIETLNIGLYTSASGERLRLQGEVGDVKSLPLATIPSYQRIRSK